MTKRERQREILNVLAEHPSLHINELLGMISASPATVRRDLTELQNVGEIVWANRMVALTGKSPVSVNYRVNVSTAEKEVIGMLAAREVENGECILLDSGTTTLAMAQNLRNRQGLTVITNSIFAATTLANSGNSVSMTGGMVQDSDMSLYGPDAEASIERIEVEKVFLGAMGMRATVGFCVINPLLVEVKKKMIAAAKTRYLLLDSSKFETVASYPFVSFDQLDYIITDKPVTDEKLLEIFERNHIRLIYPKN